MILCKELKSALPSAQKDTGPVYGEEKINLFVRLLKSKVLKMSLFQEEKILKKLQKVITSLYQAFQKVVNSNCDILK